MIKSILIYVAFGLLIVLLVPCYLLGLLAQTINLIPRLYLKLMRETEKLARGDRDDTPTV